MTSVATSSVAHSVTDYLDSFMGALQQFPAVEEVFPRFAHLYCAMATYLLSCDIAQFVLRMGIEITRLGTSRPP